MSSVLQIKLCPEKVGCSRHIFAKIRFRRDVMDFLKHLNDMLAYIESNLCDDLDPDKLAQIACMPKDGFPRVFRYMTGMTLTEYMRCRRLHESICPAAWHYTDPSKRSLCCIASLSTGVLLYFSERSKKNECQDHRTRTNCYLWCIQTIRWNELQFKGGITAYHVVGRLRFCTSPDLRWL